MTTEEARQKVLEDPDFILLPRFECSIAKLLRRYPEGTVPDRYIAQGLLITEDDVQAKYEAVVKKLRRSMKVRL